MLGLKFDLCRLAQEYTAMYSLLGKPLCYPAAVGLVMFISSLFHQSSGEACNMQLAVHKC